MTRPASVDWLVLGFCVAVWGSSFAMMKIAVEHVPPVWNVAGRLWVAVAVLGLALLVQRERLPPFSHPAWRSYALNGLIGMAVPFTLFAYAAERLPSAVNAICNGATPIFTALLAHAFTATDRLDGRRAAGVALGFGGLVFLVAPRLDGGLTVEAAGVLAAISAAAMYGVANVVTRRAPQVSATAGALMMSAWGAAFATLGAAFTGLPPLSAHSAAWLAILGQGIFPTGLATIAYVYLVQRRGPLFMSMAIYIAPLWATAVGMVFLGERPRSSAFAALALILAGVVLATLDRRQKT